MFKPRFAVLAVALVLSASPVWATSIFVEGLILTVKPDGSGYTVKGYDHYNHKSYQDKICEIPVKIASHCVFVLDNRILKRELVLAPGRHAYAIGSSAGAMLVVALSEPAERLAGQVAGADGGKLQLKVIIGADSYVTDVPLDLAVVCREGGKDAAKDAVLAAGKAVRVLPARKQTVLAYSEKAFQNAVPASTPLAVSAVIKQLGEPPTMVVAKGDAAEELKPPARKLPVVFDVSGDAAHATAATPGIGPGSPAVVVAYEKRPGVLNSWLVLQLPDEGRTEGLVKSYDDGKRALTLKVLQPDGFKDVTVTLDADAAVKLDGKEAPAAEALKPGGQVSVFQARKQTVATVAAKPAAEKH